MRPLKAICRSKKPRADGTALIYFPFYHDGEHKVLLDTGIAIPPAYWDNRQRCPKSSLPPEYGNAQRLSDEIDRLEVLARDLIKLARKQGVAPLGQYIKEKFRPDLDLDALALEEFQLKTAYVPENRKKKEPFFQQLDDYVKSKSKKVKKGTLSVYNSMILHFAAFQQHRQKTIDFASLDYQFYEDFVDFLTFDYQLPRKKTSVLGLRVNTVGKTIHHLRMFIIDRVKRKIIPAIDLSDYKVPTEDTDAVYLPYEEIEKIYRLDLSEHPELISARNLFVLGCLTGLRFSDFSALKPEDLQQDKLYKKQEKSVHWVVIPLRKEAKAIFTEQFKAEIPRICNAEFNKKIKEIAKLAGIAQTIKFSYRKGNKMIEVKKPKWAWITSHTARRSFCTNEFLAGIPVYLIMQISGHKREKDFYKYIRISPEEAAKRVMDLWMERGDLEIFKNPRNRAINLQT